MSRTETIGVACPQCAHRQEMTLWYSVNASVSPKAKAAILQDDLHVFRCQACDAKAVMDVGFMYHDMELEFCVLYCPPSSLDDPSSFDQFTPDGGLNLQEIPGFPYPSCLKRPHIVFDLDEMRRYILFRDRLAQHLATRCGSERNID